MPRHDGVYRQEWDVCDRCGFEHPLGMLSMQQGKKLCQCHGCLDDLSIYYRPKQIAESLKNSQEGITEHSQLLRQPQEIKF